MPSGVAFLLTCPSFIFYKEQVSTSYRRRTESKNQLLLLPLLLETSMDQSDFLSDVTLGHLVLTFTSSHPSWLVKT
jgi:hypothetical protein